MPATVKSCGRASNVSISCQFREQSRPLHSKITACQLFTDAVSETFVAVSFLSCLDNNSFATGKAAGKHDYYFTTLKAVLNHLLFSEIINIETITGDMEITTTVCRYNSHSHF